MQKDDKKWPRVTTGVTSQLPRLPFTSFLFLRGLNGLPLPTPCTQAEANLSQTIPAQL